MKIKGKARLFEERLPALRYIVPVTFCNQTTILLRNLFDMSEDKHDKPAELHEPTAVLGFAPEKSPYCMVQLLPTQFAGYGIFASRDIPRGTLIATEAPLVGIPAGIDDDSPTEFCAALQSLTDEDLVRLDRCSCDQSSLETIENGNIEKEITSWYQDNTMHNGYEEQADPERLQRLVEVTCRRYAIFSTNNLSMGVNDGRAVFDFFCRMNHSVSIF